MKNLFNRSSPVQFGEDDILRLIGWGLGGEVDVTDDVLILGQLQQVAVGDGRLPCSRGTHKQQRLVLHQEALQEVLLFLRLHCVDYQLVNLQYHPLLISDCPINSM